VEKAAIRRRLTLLGTGTSQGVPVIGCDCPVCRSEDPLDTRLRTAALLTIDGFHVVIDVGPDFRQQMLRERVKQLDAVLLTHEHNDHVIGLDDIRPFNFSSGRPMAVYALPRVVGEVRKRFEYVFQDPVPGVPRIQLLTISAERSLYLGGNHIQPIGIMHGRLPILGFRIADLAYLTDVKWIAEEEWPKLEGVRTLVVSALHRHYHQAHMNLDEALAFVERLKPKEAWLTHISHRMGLARDTNPLLPDGVRLAYDGLHIDF
jgi:phosphoribosyl 1,2-cyclic phosphate phosphodiesterase